MPHQEIYCYANFGMYNDDTMFRATENDDDLSRGCGIYEVYPGAGVRNASGIPHTMFEYQSTRAGDFCGGAINPVISMSKYDENDIFTFKKYHLGRVVIMNEREEQAKEFCDKFVGKVYDECSVATKDGNNFYGHRKCNSSDISCRAEQGPFIEDDDCRYGDGTVFEDTSERVPKQMEMGKCRTPPHHVVFEFLLGSTITRSLERLT